MEKKLLMFGLLILITMSVANAGLLTWTEKETAKIDAVFPELIYNTNDCLVDCSATFKYCLDTEGTYELNFDKTFGEANIQYGYYTTESETHKENTNCAKEEIIEHKCDEKQIENGTKDCNYNETVCNEWEQKDVTTESQVWHYGLPSEKAGCYEISIIGKKNANENVDWQPTIVKKGFLWDTEYTQDKWAWWNTSWTYNRAISNLTKNISYMNITYDSDMQSDFDDLRFISNDNVTELNYTIESYSASNWAITRVGTNSNTSVYMYYGNPSATTTGNSSKLYRNPISYWFLDDVGTNVTKDELNLNNGSIICPLELMQNTTGIVGYGYNFNGSCWINIPDSPSLDIVNNISIVSWIKPTSTSGQQFPIARDINTGRAYAMSIVTGKYTFMTNGGASTFQPTTSPSTTNYMFTVATFNDATNRLEYYYNGTFDNNGTITDTLNAVTSNLSFGRRLYPSFTMPYTGVMDEVGLYNRILTATEVAYLNSTNTPNYVLGDETSGSSIWAFGTPLPTNFTNISSSTIDFNATPQGSFATMSCNLTINGTVNMTNSTVQNNTLTNFQASGIADGYHNYTIDCWNGTISNSTFVRYFTVDTTLPDVWFTSPTESAPASFISRTWAQINATATDLRIANMTLEWNYTNMTFNTSTYTNATYQRGYSNLSGLADGEYYFRVFANDTFGNWNVSETRMVEVDTTAPNTTATAVGNVTGNSYTWGSTSSEGLNITLTCNDGSGIGCAVTRYCIDELDSCAPNTTYSGVIEYSTTGNYYIRFYSNDTLNNTEVEHSENFIITVSGSTPLIYYLSYNNSGDTFTRQASPTSNYGTLTTMYTSNSANMSYVWMNATDMFNAGHKIYVTYLNYTVVNISAPNYIVFEYCANTINYSKQNETSLTDSNASTLCSSFNSLTSFATGGFKQQELSAIINTSNKLGIIRFEGATSNDKVYIYTKEYGVVSTQPKLLGLYAGAGNIFVNSAMDSSTGAYVISNVSFSNGTTTSNYNNIGTTSYGSGNFSYITSNQMTGTITTTVVDSLNKYYPVHFYSTLINGSAPLEIYPALINKTSPSVAYVTFYVVDSIGNPIEGATINIYQNGSLAQQGYTDSSGSVALYLYSDVSYQVTASQGTTTSSTYSITPTLSAYTIVLGIDSIELPSNIFDTINYVITPMTVTIPNSTSTPIMFYVWNSAGDSTYTRIYLYFTNGSLAGYTSSSSSHGANLTVNVNTNTTNTTRIDGFFEISRIDMGSYNITRNFVIKSYTNYTYSFTNILNNFKNTGSISSDWKQIIAVCFSIGIAIFVFRYVGDVGSLLTGAVCFTIMGWMGWINFIIPLLIWLITIGYIFIKGGLF